MLYKIKIKDLTQDTTHSLSEEAKTPNEANEKALKWLRKYIGNNDYTIRECKPAYKKYTY